MLEFGIGASVVWLILLLSRSVARPADKVPYRATVLFHLSQMNMIAVLFVACDLVAPVFFRSDVDWQSASCPVPGYEGMGCVAICLGLANATVASFAARSLYSRARAVHGSNKVKLPDLPLPSQPEPPSYAPAWTRGLVTELDLPAGTKAEVI
ncbi:hypothetical protein FB451DRAFT_1403474 [Mycena latifolia]|nr:hypothetical protein FB451DRAFT_1403474 [Mycena latifolia]